MGTSHEGLRTYYCCQRHQFASTALLQNTEFFFYNVGSDRCYATMNIHVMYCVSVHAENMECPILFPSVYTGNSCVRINCKGQEFESLNITGPMICFFHTHYSLS